MFIGRTTEKDDDPLVGFECMSIGRMNENKIIYRQDFKIYVNRQMNKVISSQVSSDLNVEQIGCTYFTSEYMPEMKISFKASSHRLER